MGRDGVLSTGIFGHINPRFSTPTRSIYLTSLSSLLGVFFLRFGIAVELLNVRAFAGFVLVNLSVIRYFYFKLRRSGGWQTLNYSRVQLRTETARPANRSSYTGTY